MKNQILHNGYGAVRFRDNPQLVASVRAVGAQEPEPMLCCPAFLSAAKAPGVATIRPSSKAGCLLSCCIEKTPFVGFVFLLLRGTAESGTLKANALPGGARRLAVRAVKGAWFSRLSERSGRPLTGEADGPGAGFQQEGQDAVLCLSGFSVRIEVWDNCGQSERHLALRRRRRLAVNACACQSRRELRSRGSGSIGRSFN